MTVSSQSFKPLEGAIREGGGRTGFMLLLFAILGVVAFFWDGGAALIEGWSRPEYSYGPLVPFVSAFMLLREIRDRPPLLEGGSRVPGLFVIGFGLLIGFVGNVSQIPDLIIYGMIIVVGGLMLVIVGIRQAGHYWTGWLHLFF
ncbi:MAG: archaeosortase/exosortase family protein, partial [Alphaproteobacteria bacterium]|nr:archaeosortase/exosortase family protein [Alphaproteobacteria bacterium]